MRNTTTWWLTVFAVGFVAGAGALSLLRRFVPAPAAAQARSAEDEADRQIREQTVSLLRSINRRLDDQAPGATKPVTDASPPAAAAQCQPVEVNEDAKMALLLSDLQTVRSQLELYKVQHGQWPTGGTSAAWTAQLTQPTDRDGSPGKLFGPYLQTFPANPFNGSAEVLIDRGGTTSPGTSRTTGRGACGWYFNARTGAFAPNSAGHGEL